MTLSNSVDAQGGLESVGKAERVASLTGIRAVAALLVMLTHAAYTTGKYTHGYAGLVYSRAEIGVPIFFVLSGFLLFGPWVKAAATAEPPSRRHQAICAAVGAPLRLAPGAAHHARLRRHRAGGVPAVPLPHGGPESRPHMGRPVPQPHADPDLHRQLSVFLSAPRAYADVEPGGRGRVLRRVAAAGLSAAGGAVPAPVAAADCCWRASAGWRCSRRHG